MTMNGSSESVLLQEKKKRRGSAGESFVEMFIKPIKRKDSVSREDDNDAKEEDDSVSEEEENHSSIKVTSSRAAEKKRSKTSMSTTLGTSLSSSPKEDLLTTSKRNPKRKSKNLSCNDVSQLVDMGSPPQEKKPDSPLLTPVGASTIAKEDKDKLDKDSLHGSGPRKKSSDSVKMKRGSVPYMQNKFDLQREEAESLVRDFRSVLHKKVIHHGVMYIYPNHICWLSNSHSTKAKIPFALVTNIKKNPMSVTVEVEMNGYPKIYKFSHLYKRTVTHKVLTLVWRYSKGDKTVSLDEIRCNKTLQDISLDPQAADAESDQDVECAEPPIEDLCDEDILMPPVSSPPEKPPNYDKGPILSVVFPISLPRFWHYFLSDESTHYRDAHIAKGDKDPSLTPWKLVDGRLERVLEVKADVKSKLVKGLCPVHSVQKCYMLDAEHMIKEAESTQEGVPYSSDFINRGYWEITATSPNSTEVKIWLWVIFIKSPLVKAIIEKSSINGMKDFTVVWLGEAHKTLKKMDKAKNQGSKEAADIPDETDTAELKIEGVTATSPSVFSGLLSDWKLLLIFVLFSLLLAVSLYSYFSIASLRSENERLTAEMTMIPSKSGDNIVDGDADAKLLAHWEKQVEELKQLAVRLQQGLTQLSTNKG